MFPLLVLNSQPHRIAFLPGRNSGSVIDPKMRVLLGLNPSKLQI
jgi:hypothetical protein